MAQLGSHPVAADTVFIDIDGAAEDVEATKQKLLSMGITFEQWHTGRRGGHFHIPTTFMQGSDVPWSHKMWVAEHFAPMNPDMSIYTHTGQWRLPYTVHEKNPGHVKQLIFEHVGTTLTVPMVSRPTSDRVDRSTDFDLKRNWLDNLTRECGSGQRAPHIYILCCNAVELGLDCDEATEEIQRWNSRFARPAHDERYIANKVLANYMQLTRGTSYGRQRNSVSTPTGNGTTTGT